MGNIEDFIKTQFCDRYEVRFLNGTNAILVFSEFEIYVYVNHQYEMDVVVVENNHLLHNDYLRFIYDGENWICANKKVGYEKLKNVLKKNGMVYVVEEKESTISCILNYENRNIGDIILTDRKGNVFYIELKLNNKVTKVG